MPPSAKCGKPTGATTSLEAFCRRKKNLVLSSLINPATDGALSRVTTFGGEHIPAAQTLEALFRGSGSVRRKRLCDRYPLLPILHCQSPSRP